MLQFTCSCFNKVDAFQDHIVVFEYPVMPKSGSFMQGSRRVSLLQGLRMDQVNVLIIGILNNEKVDWMWQSADCIQRSKFLKGSTRFLRNELLEFLCRRP